MGDGMTLEHRTDNLITMRDYIDVRFAAVDKALVVALETLNYRLASMNEFRETIRDQSSTFVNHSDLAALAKDIQYLREERASLSGMASQRSVSETRLIALIGLGIAIGTFLFSMIERLR